MQANLVNLLNPGASGNDEGKGASGLLPVKAAVQAATAPANAEKFENAMSRIEKVVQKLQTLAVRKPSAEGESQADNKNDSNSDSSPQNLLGYIFAPLVVTDVENNQGGGDLLSDMLAGQKINPADLLKLLAGLPSDNVDLEKLKATLQAAAQKAQASGETFQVPPALLPMLQHLLPEIAERIAQVAAEKGIVLPNIALPVQHDKKEAQTQTTLLPITAPVQTDAAADAAKASAEIAATTQIAAPAAPQVQSSMMVKSPAASADTLVGGTKDDTLSEEDGSIAPAAVAPIILPLAVPATAPVQPVVVDGASVPLTQAASNAAAQQADANDNAIAAVQAPVPMMPQVTAPQPENNSPDLFEGRRNAISAFSRTKVGEEGQAQEENDGAQTDAFVKEVTKVTARLSEVAESRVDSRPEAVADRAHQQLVQMTQGVSRSNAAQPGFARILPQIHHSPVAEQVMVKLHAAAQEGASKIEIRLNPAELGKVDVKMEVGSDGRVNAVVTADNKDTFDMLQRDARLLERALHEAGLKTDSNSLSFNLRQNGQGQHQADGNGGGNGQGGQGRLPSGGYVGVPVEELSAVDELLGGSLRGMTLLDVEPALDIKA